LKVSLDDELPPRVSFDDEHPPRVSFDDELLLRVSFDPSELDGVPELSLATSLMLECIRSLILRELSEFAYDISETPKASVDEIDELSGLPLVESSKSIHVISETSDDTESLRDCRLWACIGEGSFRYVALYPSRPLDARYSASDGSLFLPGFLKTVVVFWGGEGSGSFHVSSDTTDDMDARRLFCLC